ncbi:MAG: C-type lectin domain-containing protein [Lachnospiraceae bacterium]|nr:C-type lectin domain-containing protein [Lachnospiraceae bacterium]
MKKITTISMIICIINFYIFSISASSNNLPANTIKFNSNSYKFYNETLNWHEAKEKCEELGGHLATISSEEENHFLKSNIPDNDVSFFWIGGTDEKEEGNWKWVTGEAFNFTCWSENSPNNNWDSENYLGFISKRQNYDGFSTPLGSWNDFCISTTENSGFICEWENSTISDNNKNDKQFNINITIFDISILGLGGISILGGITIFSKNITKRK